MNAFSPILSGFCLLIGVFASSESDRPRQARRRGLSFAIAALLVQVVTLILSISFGDIRLPFGQFVLVGPRHLMLAALVSALLGVVAIGLAPVSQHRPDTISRMLILILVSEVFLSTQNPLTLAALWLVSAGVVYLELSSTPELKDVARLFLIYQVPSALLFAYGAWALTSSEPESAALPLLLAIAIREAVLPVHGWFVRFVDRAPMGIVVAFVAPQLGVYAHLELLHQGVASDLSHLVGAVGAVSALFFAFMAVGQTRVRRAVAYLVMSQTGLVSFGLENVSPVGWSGAVLTWLVSALGISSFLLCISAVSARRGELVLGKSAGSPAQVPRLAVATLLSGLATVGIPLSLGFVAEDLLVQGSISEHPILGLGLVVVTALNGITVMRIYFGLFTAGPHRPGERDVRPSEAFALSLVLGLLLLFGVFPGALVAFIQ